MVYVRPEIMYKLKAAPQVRTQKLNVAFVLFLSNS